MEDLIRCAGPGDMGWVIGAHGREYGREFGFDGEFELGIAAKMVAVFQGKEPFNTLWVAREKEGRAGSVAVSRKSETTAFLNFLLVLPQFRGRGLARMLLDRAADHARAGQCQWLELETYSILTSARCLYADYGFEKIEVNEGMRRFGHTFDQEFWRLAL